VAGACTGQSPACGNLACAAGETAFFFAGATSVTIVDQGLVSSSLSVGIPGVVKRAVVQLYVTHSFDADLDLTLKAPGGATIDLSSDNGSSGNDYQATVLDGLCATSVASGSAPFVGSFAPETSLSSLNGTQAVGTWALQIADDAVQDTGTLVWWHLYLCIK